MANLKIFFTFTVFLLLASSSLHSVQAYDSGNPGNAFYQMANNLKALGRTASCIADLGNDHGILAKGYQICGAAIAYVKQAIGHSDVVNIARIVVDKSLYDFRAIDKRCSNVPHPFIPLNTPPEAAEFAKLGDILEATGKTLNCLIAKADPQMISQIPNIIGKNVEGIARDSGSAKSTVAILLLHDILLAENLRKLSSDCY